MNGLTLRKLLIALMVSRLLFALLLVYTGASDIEKSDAIGYVGLAHSLLHGSYSDPYQAEALWPPAYPVLLMPAVASGHVRPVALIENIALATLAGWLVWLITDALLPGSSAKAWALLLYCCEPTGLFYSAMVLSETLFTTLFLIFVLLLVRFLHSGRIVLVIVAAAALAAATYTRAVSLYLGLVVVALLAFYRRFAAALLFACVFAALLSPWVVRNYILYDYPAFSSSGAFNLYQWPEASIDAALSGKSIDQVRADLGFFWGPQTMDNYFVRHPEQRNWKLGKIYSYMASQALHTIAKHPILYTRIHLKGCLILLLDPNRFGMGQMGLLSSDHLQLREVLSRQTLASFPIGLLVFALVALQLLLYYGAAALGLRFLPRTASVFLVAIIVYFVVVSGMPNAMARYRVPFMPIICIAASPMFARLAKSVASRSSAYRDRQPAMSS